MDIVIKAPNNPHTDHWFPLISLFKNMMDIIITISPFSSNLYVYLGLACLSLFSVFIHSLAFSIKFDFILLFPSFLLKKNIFYAQSEYMFNIQLFVCIFPIKFSVYYMNIEDNNLELLFLHNEAFAVVKET